MSHPFRAARMVALVLAFVIAGTNTGPARAAPEEELQVQAAYLYNFVKFCTWPDDSAQPPPALFLGVYGTNPFGPALDELKGAIIKGRMVSVIDVSTPVGARRCQLLYVARTEAARVPSILAAVAEHPVLTISEAPGFARAGGVIEFVIVSDTVKFKVNVNAARRSNLKLSSQLLGVAIEIVRN